MFNLQANLRTNLIAASLLLVALPSIALSAQSNPTADPSTKMPSRLGPIVISATRTATPSDEIASSITVIDRAAIENSGETHVVGLLRSVPGVAIAQAGGPGQQSSLFLRGSNSNHVLVLIDGIEISDPSNPTGQVDFAHLLVDDIERIEVVRGPQSTLFGSDAIGGVIQIFTRRDHAGGSVYSELGSFDTHRFNARVGTHGQSGAFGMSLGVVESNGISAANEKRGNGEEADAYQNTNFSVHGAYQPTRHWEVAADLRLQQTEAEIDNFFASFPPPSPFVADDPDAESDTDQLFSRLHAEWQSASGRWTQRWQISHSDHERQNRNGPLGSNPFSSESDFEGQKLKLEWRHEVLATEAQRLSFGLETENEEMQSSGVNDESARTNAAYLQDQLRFNDSVFTTLGLRYDDHERFGSETTWRLAPVWIIVPGGTRLKASYGTGFKAPTLSQAFESFPTFYFANPDLQPETSTGWDLGIEQPFNGGSFELTYYRNDIDNLITFVSDPVTFVGTLDNVQKAETSGYEAVLTLNPSTAFDINLQFSNMEAKNLDTGADLLRRPDKTAAIHLDWRPDWLASHLGLTARYVGERDDIDGVGNIHRLEAYSVVDASASFPLAWGLSLNIRAENLFDEDYEEIVGYGTPGRAGYLGLRWVSGS